MKKILSLILSLLLMSPCIVYGATPTRQNSYQTGTTIRSADVTANENTLFNHLQAGVEVYADGTIVNADVSSAAAITYAKLSLSNTIVNADINSSAAIAYSKLSLAGTIVNADISTSAAIVDTKLAQITTASKVSGAALTSFTSIPSGAGVIPSANLASGTASAFTFINGSQQWQGVGVQIFNSNGTFTAPTGVTKVYLTMVGGGGGGGDFGASNGKGGGSGGVVINFPYTVVAGSGYAVTVGAGGVKGTSGGNGAAGTNSVFNSDIIAEGGGGGGGNGGAAGVGGGGLSAGPSGRVSFLGGDGSLLLGGSNYLGRGGDNASAPLANSGGGGGGGTVAGNHTDGATGRVIVMY